MQDTNFELDSMNLAEPYNMEAEQSVLGAALLDSERVMPALINTLKPEMFYSRQNAEIFSQMVELYSGTEQLDAVTLIDAVASTGVFESMEAAKVYIARLGEVVPSISNFGAYARIVEEKYLTRQVMQLAQNILKQSSAQPDADMLLESVEQRLTDIRSNQKREELTKLFKLCQKNDRTSDAEFVAMFLYKDDPAMLLQALKKGSKYHGGRPKPR